MRTKLILCIFVLCSSSLLRAQQTNLETANDIMRNVLIYQTLNEFQTNVPLFLATPGWFVFGTLQITHIPVFVDEAYYSNVPLTDKRKAFHKLLYDLVHMDFFPEIPFDKQTEIRVMDQSRLLYSLRFKPSGDTVVLVQQSGGQNDNRKYYLHDGKIVLMEFTTKHGTSTIENKVYGDSLIVKRETIARNNRFLKTEIRYHDGLPQSIRKYRLKENGKLRLMGSEKFHYYEGTLAAVVTLSRLGKQRDSTFYMHNEKGELIMNRKIKDGKVEHTISKEYDEFGLIARKHISAGSTEYRVDYSFKQNNIQYAEIRDTRQYRVERIELEADMNNRVSRVSTRRQYAPQTEFEQLTAILFGYHPNSNLDHIRVIDARGRIVKEIKFEYHYFAL